MMKRAISGAVLVMCLMVVTCEETQREVEAQGNNLNEQQIQNFQNSLFNIFDRLGNSLNQNRSTTEDKNDNNLYIIKSLVFSNFTFNFYLNTNNTENITEEKTRNAELQKRIAKLEQNSATLLQNQKSMNDQINVLNSSYTELANNTRMPSETVSVNPIDPCKSASASGVFRIQQLKQNVYCEMETFDGRWLVFQQRIRQANNSFVLNFNRPWAEYREGFGTVGKDTDFWAGLEAIHQISSSGDYELVVEMKDANEKYGYARYSKFRVAGEDDNYRLTVGGHSGTAYDHSTELNNMQFTTNDRDNDNYSAHCGKDYFNGGWWYNNCNDISALHFSKGPYWFNFTNTEESHYGTYSRMMIRRK